MILRSAAIRLPAHLSADYIAALERAFEPRCGTASMA
jgi:hypothetical protein